MKTTMQAQRPLLENWNVAVGLPQWLQHHCTEAWDYVLEACETITGVFEMPLRRAQCDRGLGCLDQGVLKDIGCERMGEPPFIR